LVLGTKKQEGVMKVTEQEVIWALRAGVIQVRAKRHNTFLLRDLGDSFLLLRAEMSLLSSTQNIAALAMTGGTPS
jgi:hypothetical protein